MRRSDTECPVRALTAFVRLGQSALENRHGHAKENRVAQQAESPDAKADQRFVQRRAVFHHFAQRRGNETGDDQSHAFFDPDADDAQHTRHVQPFQTAADRQHEQNHRRKIERDGRPNPRHERVMAVQAEVEIFGGHDMQAAGVKFSEDFADQQKHVDGHGHLHNAAQRHQRVVRNELIGRPPG